MAEAPANSPLGGYDDEFVNAIDEDWQCGICHLPMREPILTKCGHRFCTQCLNGYFARLERDRQPLICPVDRNNLLRDKDIFPDKAAERKILSFVIKCTSEGCQWTGELRSKDAHQSECREFPLNCPQKCGAGAIARGEISSHINKDCPLTTIACPHAQIGCTAKVQRRDIESHLQSATKVHFDLACVKLRKLEEKVNTLETRQMQIPGVHTWKITGFSEVMKRAKSGEQTEIFSAPFYEHGYKFRLSLVPNGQSSGKDTHVSIYFVLMKGEYDALLSWPFGEEVMFTLIDQQEDPNDRESISCTAYAKKDENCFMRPVKNVNKGCGFPRFVSHDELKGRQYIVDDTVFIQIKVFFQLK